MQKFEEIEARARELAPTQRELLANRLLDSLQDEPSNEIEAAWVDEAERRYQEMANGKVVGIPGQEVLAGIRRELGWQT
jgi:putative addiction module component (TIGR02574 family)